MNVLPYYSIISVIFFTIGCANPEVRQNTIPQTPPPQKPPPKVVMQDDNYTLAEVPLLVGFEEALQQNLETFLEFTSHRSNTDSLTSFQEILVSLRCQHADLEAVLQRFAEIGGLNLVVHPGVSGIVNARLNSVTWKHALDAIVTMNELSYTLEGTVLRVFKKNPNP